MATNTLGRNPTLADLAKLTDPDGSSAQVARLMDETNDVLKYFSFMEGNLPTGHRATMSAGIPDPTWRKLYGGTQPTTGKRVQVTDNCGELTAYGLVDKSLLELAPDPMAFRLEEDMDHIEGISQELARAIFYENETENPERITGLTPRYNSKSAGNKRNIIDAGGTGTDNRSIWLVVSGPTTITGIVPKGSSSGITVDDRGQQTVQMGTGPEGGMMEALVTYYRVTAGVSVRNWKYAVRICNIDNSDLKPESGIVKADGTLIGGANLPQLMFKAVKLIPSLGRGNAAWYMDLDTSIILEQQFARQVAQSTLQTQEVGGVMVDMFKSIPIAICDALDMDESRVT